MIPFLETIHFQQIMTVLPLVGLAMESNSFANIKESTRAIQVKAFMFFVFWMIMSVPFSVYPGLSFTFLTHNYWKTIVIILLVVGYTSTMEKYETLVWTYIIANMLLSIWVLTASSGARISIMADIYDPNDTALQFILVLPFVLWKYISTRGYKNLFSLLISLFLIAGIVGTKSRGGFVGLIAVLIITGYQAKVIGKNRIFKKALIILAIFGILFIYSGQGSMDRISTLMNLDEDYNITSSTGRLSLWKRGLDMFLKNPIIGVGVQCFITAEGVNYGGRWNAAHNSFVQVAAELGIPGLIAFCLIVYTSMKHVRKIYLKNSPIEEKWSLASHSVFGSWIGFIVVGSFLSAAYITPLYFLFALSVSFINLHKAAQVEDL